MADLRNKSSDIDRTLKIQGPEPLFSQHKWKNIDYRGNVHRIISDFAGFNLVLRIACYVC